MRLFPAISALAALLFAGAAPAATINVPADQSTIQAAINAASNGDTVLVAPGTYYELIDFKGKAITVTSSGGASVTILDGNGSGPIVNFATGEGNASVLQGFTLQHAKSSNWGSAVHLTSGTAPSILDNIFLDNIGATGYWGAAIGGYGAPIILRNYFSGNICGDQFDDSVVGLLYGGASVVADNVFVNNLCPALVFQMVPNSAPQVYNNTFVGNRDALVLQMYAANTGMFFSNNLMAFNNYGVVASFVSNVTLPTWTNNLVYGSTVADYQGVANQSGTNGNISADPALKDWGHGDVHLLYSSPAIDAGDNNVSQASATDFYGDTRIYAGRSGDAAIVDIGAAESVTPDNGTPASTIINVPADYPTIQAAINAAPITYTVVVAPGTYYEKLDFLGKAITVTSSGGATETILDGQNNGPIVSFGSGEDNSSVLQGFTLTHANYESEGAAVYVRASPMILDNIIIDNQGFSGIIGGGGSPVILRNYFADNNCEQSEDNPNTGILDFQLASPIIADNVFANNPCPAIYLSIAFSATPQVYNNTFVGNRYGLLMNVSSADTAPKFVSNNIIAFNQYGVSVTPSSGGALPTWSHNLVYGNVAADYQGVSNQTGTNGNISSDPVLKYWLGGDVHLLSSSPAIDAGDSTITQASATDFYGATRVYAGKSGDAAIVDIGAAESVTPDDVPGTVPVRNVPADYSTIQDAIDAASDGDEVLVAPGTYYEQLDFKGKVITVKSSDGAAVTTLDGNNGGPIVNFHTSEWIYSVLQGFTLAHARQDDVTGHGPAVDVGSTAPTIEDNVFVNNFDADGEGAAISGNNGSPLILRNYFTGNSGADYANNPFSVIYFVNISSPIVADNVFASNPVIAFYELGGGAPKVYNNTMVGNTTGLYVSTGGDPNALLGNNIIAFNQTGVESSSIDGSTLPPFEHNLVYGNTTADYSGVTSRTGANGNISSDPRLKDWADGDVHLLYGSPAIDAGDSTVSQASATDFYGNARVYAGMPGDSAVVDIGAIEYEAPVVTATGGSLAVPFDVAANGTLTSSNADPAEPLVFSLGTLPIHGTVTLTNASTGVFRYVPAQGYLGSDSFTFQITDPYGAVSNTATEQLTVAYEPPTANGGNVTAAPGHAVAGTLSATRAYPSQVITFSIVSNPAHGMVTLASSTGRFTYTPTTGYVGTDSFTFDAVDQYGATSNTATEQVTVAFEPATANNGSVTTTPDISVPGMLSATAAYASQALTFSIVSQPTHGMVSLTSSTGHFTYKPATAYVGTDGFTFEVTDTHGLVSNIATESITVNDVAPRARSVQIRVSSTRWGYRSTLKATTAYAGQVLSYSIVSQPAHGVVTITNAHTGAYTYHVSGNFKGNDSFTFQAVDQWGTASNVATVSARVL